MTRFLPLCLTVFCTYLVLGLSFGALPGYLHVDHGNIVVGLVIGAQSLAALLSRHLAGSTADLRGPRYSVALGALLCASAGALGLVGPLPVLVVARTVLGLGESFLITGCLSWGVALVGPQLAGRVMAWNGIAMYAAIALGAAIAHEFTIAGMFELSIVLPLVGAGCALPVARVAASGVMRMPFYEVLGHVWRGGVGLALATVGFSGIASFVPLYFAARGWDDASLVLAVFGGFYIGVRLLFAHLPDKHGGGPVALVALLVQMVGQLVLWFAPNHVVALAGAALIGAGFSLVFPAFGVEAIKRVAPANRGAALGAFVAFFDLALGTAAPICGVIANVAGYASIFLFGAICSAIAALIAASVRRRSLAGRAQ